MADQETSNAVDQNDKDAVPNETDAQREKRRIKSLITHHDQIGLKEGSSYCLISARWWSQWQHYVQYNSLSYQGERPGPIENDFLLDAEGELRTTEIQERYHFHFLPKEAWDLLHSWYGGGPMIERFCIRSWNTLTIELKKYKLQVIWSRKPKEIVTKSFGKSTTIKTFLDEMHKTMKWNPKNIRVIDFYQARRTSVIHPERWNRTLEECQIMDKQYVLIEEMKKNGTWPHEKLYKHLQAPQSYYEAPPSPPGQTGLSNLGNTCFMNSALQCLSATVPLTDFMLKNDYLTDLNTTNPLGMGGEIAKEYRKFLGELWSSKVGVHAPRDMKGRIERFAPQFNGYAQHDSQELLAFLLDGLHEDLNRIIKKPPVEVLDTWTPEEAWEGHKKRNDSIIVDLFQGQLKSRLRCPNNQRVSTVYDPFMYLTVPLPVMNNRKIVVTVHRMDPSLKPLKIGVVVDKDGSIKDLKQGISNIVGIPPEALVVVDMDVGRFYREWPDTSDISDIRENDITAAYEIVPTKKKAKQPNSDGESSEDTEPETVRIIIYHEKREKRSYGTNLFGTPLILSVPEDITYAQLYLKIVHHLSGGAPPGATSGGVLKEIPPLQVTTDPPPTGAPPNESFAFDDNTVFELIYGGSARYLDCVNNGSSLNLVDRRQINVTWTKKLYARFIDESKLNTQDYEIHESFKTVLEKKGGNIPLYDCLALFNEEEQLAASDTWYCSDCKEHVQAFKKFSVWTAPKILVIHLKRFSYRGRMMRERLDAVIDFPFTDLDMSPYIEGPKGPAKYDLFAVSNHYGSLGGGHYTAYAKSRNGDQWFKFDDSSVSPVSDPSKIVGSAAYVLFYKRQDVEWPSFDPALDQAKKTPQPSEESEDNSDEYEQESEENGVDNKDNGVAVGDVVVQDDIGQAPAPIVVGQVTTVAADESGEA
jgi:ubiquitin carboxyl-terminal hydrolase 4/11/15